MSGTGCTERDGRLKSKSLTGIELPLLGSFDCRGMTAAHRVRLNRGVAMLNATTAKSDK